MNTQVPYTVAVAHPDYERPYVSIDHGVGSSDTVMEKLAEKYVKAMYKNGFDPNKTFEEITQKRLDDFLENYWNDGYMCNEPIEIRYFFVVWTTYYPTVEDINDAMHRLYDDQ